MAVRGEHFPQRGTDLAATPAVAMSVSVACTVVVFVVCGVRVGVVGHAPRPCRRTRFDSALMMVPGCSFASSAAAR
jgi:hypothetical protein